MNEHFGVLANAGDATLVLNGDVGSVGDRIWLAIYISSSSSSFYRVYIRHAANNGTIDVYNHRGKRQLALDSSSSETLGVAQNTIATQFTCTCIKTGATHWDVRMGIWQ